jgi:hypothetical protein
VRQPPRDRSGKPVNEEPRDRLQQARAFLAWLENRGRTLTECTQADVDAWFASPPISRRLVQPFLRWCSEARTLPRLQIPVHSTENPAPLTQHRRITLIRRMFTEETLPLLDRVVALLILLYAQPVTRIVRLTIDDVSHDGDQLFLRLGEPPSPVPAPFAALLQTYIQTRPNTATATNPNSRWLFPGRRAGQPMTIEPLHGRLRKADIPRLNARTASIRQLVLQAPASVVAEMRGYHVEHAENLAAEGGGPWKTYAPGDHTP